MSNRKIVSVPPDQPLLFTDLGSRQVVADFTGGTLSSDAGALLLRQVDAQLGLTWRLAQCFADGRKQLWVDHSVQQMLAQRLYALALGYEDLNDHQRLRLDPLLAALPFHLDQGAITAEALPRDVRVAEGIGAWRQVASHQGDLRGWG